MIFKKIAPIAALSILAGCVTTDVTTNAVPVDTWAGLDTREMIPPLQLVAAANMARSQGRVIGGGRRAGGAYVLASSAELTTACADRIATDDGPLEGCTVRRVATSGWTYTVYVSDAYPEWYRELIATREFGHVGQSEYGQPFTDDGFTSPTVSLIRRLGG